MRRPRIRRIRQPAVTERYYRAEVIAGAINISRSKFSSLTREFDFARYRFGQDQRMVFFDWREVFTKLSFAGYRDLPVDKLSFGTSSKQKGDDHGSGLQAAS